MPHASVTGLQRQRAKELRANMTRAEILLWRHLKAGRVAGLSFRRQVPMGNFIADFTCHQARLIIEIDGESHDFATSQAKDMRRDNWFRGQGYEILRFTNEEVMSKLEGVVAMICDAAEKRIQNSPPSLTLPRKGGGNRIGGISEIADAGGNKSDGKSI